MGAYLSSDANFMLYDDIETDYGHINFPGNAGQIMMLTEFSVNEVDAVDFMNNSSNWQSSENSVRNAF